MLYLLANLPPLSHIIARGGGGGSGGGGGGGGGGIAMLGYFPAYYSTQWLNKHADRGVAIIGGSFVGLLIAVLFGFLGIGVGIIVGIGAIIGVYSGINSLHSRLLRRSKTAKQQLSFAANNDPMWQETELQARVQAVFTDFQNDWSSFNLEHMRSYTTPRYYGHMELMLSAMYQMGRRNEVASPTILSTQVVNIDDQVQNDQDNFDIYIQAKANDSLLDTSQNKTIYTDKNSFEELWHFVRQDNTWLLDGISQATANALLKSVQMQAFAQKNGMYYSLDMGWLLLPQRGQLFSKASFKNSDVNNHVIGNWGGRIVQLYTYIPAKNNAQNYLIGQLALPKSYGGIIIKRRTRLSFFTRPWHGYQKISFEWPDFNKRFDVYATDADKVTSFELLNPAFMADLYDRNLQVNIEVVDNVVYLYSGITKAENRYADMLDVLKKAYKELYM
jgi:hypothetical protein